MKKILLIFVVLILLIVTSCGKDDEPVYEGEETNNSFIQIVEAGEIKTAPIHQKTPVTITT